MRLAAVSLALFGTMSGLAVAGALPAPVQNAVSGVAQTVGFDLPDSQPTAEAPAATATGSWEQGTNGVGGNGGGATPSVRPVPETSATTAPTDTGPLAVADGPPASTPTPSTVAADRPRGGNAGHHRGARGRQQRPQGHRRADQRRHDADHGRTRRPARHHHHERAGDDYDDDHAPARSAGRQRGGGRRRRVAGQTRNGPESGSPPLTRFPVPVLARSRCAARYSPTCKTRSASRHEYPAAVLGRLPERTSAHQTYELDQRQTRDIMLCFAHKRAGPRTVTA